MLTASFSPDVIVVMLEIALFLSTSLLAAGKLIFLIHMLNTIACVLASKMVRLMFEFPVDAQGRSVFLATTVTNSLNVRQQCKII